MLVAPRIDGPSYETLEPGHPLYEVAAWAYHYGPALPLAGRRGLFIALSRAWPVRQPRGRPPDAEQRAWHAGWLADHGRSAEDVAGILHVSVDYARRLISRRAELVSYVFTHPEDWRVDSLTGDPEERPEDPAGLTALARVFGEDLAHAMSDDLRRAETAGGRAPGT